MMALKTLKIEPGAQPHQYRFSVDGHDISNMISGAEITFNTQKVPRVTLHIVADIDIPDEMEAEIFRGDRTNGSLHSSNT
jgi:hypothetical protein